MTDVNEFHRAHGADALRSHLDRRSRPFVSGGHAGPKISNASELQNRDFPPVKWVVPGFLPEGVTVLAGAPKVGKSWLALDIARAVAAGGEALGQPCEQGDVLLLALEDNDRRLQNRLDRITGEEDWPAALHYATEWSRLDAGGVDHIAAWLDEVGKPRLVVIDTLAMVKPVSRARNGSAYDHDVAALRPLHELASTRGIGVVVVTHIRKMDADDPVERVSSTMGLTGVADTIATLTRGQAGDGHVLYARGRDLAEFERAVRLVDCRWQIEGDPLEAAAGDTWRAILKAMRAGASRPTEIAAATDLPGATVRQNVRRMAKQGAINSAGYGRYELPSQLSHLSQFAETPEELRPSITVTPMLQPSQCHSDGGPV